MIDTTTASGRLMFGIFAALAEFERELIFERTTASIAAAKARGKHCGRPHELTPKKIHLLQKAMGKRQKIVVDVVAEGRHLEGGCISLCRPDGELRADARRLLSNEGESQDQSAWKAICSKWRRSNSPAKRHSIYALTYKLCVKYTSTHFY